MSTGALYSRKASLVVAPIGGQPGLDLEALRFAFAVKKTSTSHPNTATIKVYNLAEKSRNAIVIKKTALILRAGYGDATPPVLASGVIQRAEHTPQPPEVESELEIRDGG